jgi:hypothetical protein
METIQEKRFIGVVRSHPSNIGGADRNFEVEIIAKDLGAAEAEMVQIIKKKGISIIDGYSIKEAKTP